MTTNPAGFKGLGNARSPRGSFWRVKALETFTPQEWEALCDRCGLCCLEKLQDADSGAVVYTDVACRHLDIDACRCKVYPRRQARMAGCLRLTPENLAQVHWLPPTCAYRLLREGRPLPPWHPLISGHGRSVHHAQRSARHIAVAPDQVRPQQLVHHVIDLFPEDRRISPLAREIGF